MTRFVTFLLLLAGAPLLTGCDAGFQTTGASEHGVIFSALPRFLGGGVKDRVVNPTAKVFVLPWETLYRIDTSVQSVGWGIAGQGETGDALDYVETRARDGNEVGLAMRIQYRVRPEMIPYVIQRVGIDDERIRKVVATIGRADIRTHMNVLKTQDFFVPELRQQAVDQVREALQSRLAREGIAIESVIYVDHRFERRIEESGQVVIDRRYQQQIDETQAYRQKEEQEQKRIATVIQEKALQLNEAQAKSNRRLQEVEGIKRQAVVRGDATLDARKNEAEQIRALGMAEVEGLKKQVAALSGPGGKALLRLAVVQALRARDPKFVVVNSASGQHGIDLSRIDTNELLREAGIFSAMTEGARPAPATPQNQKSDAAPQPSPEPQR